ncbi:MAG: hypothetical protein IKO72_12750 [Kiritimatiellae bacterium]|nr:hypothetical protein [Kiritimatiellia bacterium]
MYMMMEPDGRSVLVRRACALVCAWTCAAGATVYYADSEHGDDSADGLSEKTAWRSLDKVNECEYSLKPGDTVLFRRGSVWRGTLYSASGEPGNPVRYGAYGTGPKPCFLGSEDRSRPEHWLDDGGGIWVTRRQVPRKERLVMDFKDGGKWHPSFQEGVKGTFRRTTENGETFWRVTCTERPDSAKSNHLQLWGPAVADRKPLLFTFKARASKPMTLTKPVQVLEPAYPWRSKHVAEIKDGVLPPDGAWRTFTLLLLRNARVRLDNACLHFNIGSDISAGTTFDLMPVSLHEAYLDPYAGFDEKDVGIFICDHGRRWGVKKWARDQLVNELDFWYDIDTDRVFVRLPRNPGEMFRSIELAKRMVVIPHVNLHDIVWDSLAIMYTGGFAFAGSGAKRLTVRNCDMGWIGGSVQHWRTDAKGKRHPVRFGNAVEYWSPAWSNTVERCRIWQVYDAALTPQTSRSPHPIHHITFRDNVIWKCEYSLEYWNHDTRSYTSDIVFEHNTCVDAGGAWSHAQRPDRNGAHVLSYRNPAPCTNIVVRDNVFCRTTERAVRVLDDWRRGAVFSHNLYWVPENGIYRNDALDIPSAKRRKIGKENFFFESGPEEFARYQRVTGMDADSFYGEPQFVDEAKCDYRLRPGSFGTGLATDGGPVGARDMPGPGEDLPLIAR